MNLKWVTLKYSRENPVTPGDFKSFEAFKPVLVDISKKPFKFIGCNEGLVFTNKKSSDGSCDTRNEILKNLKKRKLTLEQILKEFEIN